MSKEFDEFMDLVKSSQTEISDEEIEKASENKNGYFDYESKKYWKQAIKWYREQLKKKQ